MKCSQAVLIIISIFSCFGGATAQEIERFWVIVEPIRSDSLDVPASVTVLEDNPSLFLSPRAPAELLNRATSVLVQSGSGREHLTSIRSPVLTGSAGAGSFLFLQDGVPMRAPGFANVNGLFHAAFPFADEVTVIRGPGDVAYGSNALHGAINVATPAPGEADSFATISTGSFDRHRAVGSYNADTWAGGLSVLSDGGYRADSGALDVKARWAAKVGPGLLRASLHQLEQETAGFVVGDDAFRVDALRRSNPNPEAFRDVRHGLVSYHLPIRHGAWVGEIVPYARWTDMAFLQHFLPGDALEENEHASIGLQSLAARDLGAGTQLTLGFDLDLTDGALREFQEQPTVFSFVQGLHYDYRVKALEAAPFAKIARDLSPKLRLEAGVRSTVTSYDYQNDAPSDVVGRFLRLPDRSDDVTAVTGKLSVRYHLATNHAVFVSVARGARPPQSTDFYRLQQNQDISDIDPETLDSLELGWRARSPGVGQLAVTAFAMEKRDVFFRDADGFNVTDGVTTHVGIEAEGEIALTERLSLRAGGTWAEHRYGFDREVGNGSETIGDGDLVDTAPRTLANLQLTWTPTQAWRVELAGTHVGSYAMNAANTVFYDGHDLLDLRVQRFLSKEVALTFVTRNLTDERYARRADFAFGNERYFPGEERAFELILGAKF